MDYETPYRDYAEVDERGLLNEDRRHAHRWFSVPGFLVLILLPVLILIKTPFSYLLGAMLAYLNCLLGGWAIIQFVKKGTMESLVAILFLPLLLVSWPLGSIYFAMFYPDFTYGLIHSNMPLLYGMERVQLCVLLFLAG